MNEGTKRIVTIVVAVALLGVAGYRLYKQYKKKAPAQASQTTQSGAGEGEMMQSEAGMGESMGEQSGMDPGMQGGMDPAMEPGMQGGMDPAMEPGMQGGMDPAMEPGMQGGMDPAMMEPGMGGPGGSMVPPAWQGVWVLDVDASVKQAKQLLSKVGKTMTPAMEQQARQYLAANPNRMERRQLGANVVTRVRGDMAGQVREQWSLQVLGASEQLVRAKILACRTEILSGQDSPTRRGMDRVLPGKELQIKCRNGYMWFTFAGGMRADGVFRKQPSPAGE